MTAINETEVRRRIEAAVEASGLTRKAWAAQHGIAPSALTESINGPQAPRPSVLKALGITRRREQGRGFEYLTGDDEA